MSFGLPSRDARYKCRAVLGACRALLGVCWALLGVNRALLSVYRVHALVEGVI